MSSTESIATPDGPEPLPGAHEDGPASGPAVLSPVRLVYWSVRRELWECRWIYTVPLIVAAVFLVGFVIGTARVPYPFPRNVHFPAHSLPRLLAAAVRLRRYQGPI